MIERVADGKRRFFAAQGTVTDVLIRDRKGHQDRALEPGRDYEIEPGGVALAQVPPAGARVVILIGAVEPAAPPVVQSEGAVTVIRHEPQIIERVRTEVVHVPVERIVEVPKVVERLVEVPAPAKPAQSGESGRLGISALREMSAPIPPSAAQPIENASDKSPLNPAQMGAEIDPLAAVKHATVMAIASVSEAHEAEIPSVERDAWRKVLAQKAVAVWSATTHAGVLAAHNAAVAFIKGQGR